MRATISAMAFLGCAGATAVAGGCGALSSDCHRDLTCEVVNPDGSSNGKCLGTCLPGHPEAFDDPVLVWMGAPDAMPRDCPPPSTNEYWHGYADLKQSDFACSECVCSAPECALPSGITAHSGIMCTGGPGDTLTPFDAPSGWGGSCVSPGAVPPALFGSYEVPPATVIPCAPVRAQVPLSGDFDLGSPWKNAVKACSMTFDESACPEDSEPRWATCMKGVSSEDPPGWRPCIVANGENIPCPSDWPDPHSFYKDVEDRRTCTECICTTTESGTCTPLVSTYEDRACQQLIDSTVVGGDRICHDASTGTTLGSVSATWLVNAPGRCEASRREVRGSRVTTTPKTFCCRGAI